MFCLRDGINRLFEEIKFVAKLKCNLISIGEVEKTRHVFKGSEES